MGRINDWELKALELGFEIDNFIEEYASTNNEKMGFDIADYLLRFPIPTKEDYFESDMKECGIEETALNEETFTQHNQVTEDLFYKTQPLIEKQKRENWDKEIAEIELYFHHIEIPIVPVKLDQCTTINNASEYVNRALEVVKANNGISAFYPEILRLQHLARMLKV